MSEHDAAKCRMVMEHYRRMLTEEAPAGIDPENHREAARGIIESIHRLSFGDLVKLLIADGWQAETAYACARHMEATRG